MSEMPSPENWILQNQQGFGNGDPLTGHIEEGFGDEYYPPTSEFIQVDGKVTPMGITEPQ